MQRKKKGNPEALSETCYKFWEDFGTKAEEQDKLENIWGRLRKSCSGLTV